MEFTITHTDEVLVSHSGLALAGALLKQSPLRKRLDEIRLGQRKRPEVPHGDVLMAMIGLLCLGKSDYADIETFRHEEFFRRSLDLQRLPSEETIRQRMDQLGTTPIATMHEESAQLIARHASTLAWSCICLEDRGLATAAKHAFGGWKQALAAAGLVGEPKVPVS